MKLCNRCREGGGELMTVVTARKQRRADGRGRGHASMVNVARHQLYLCVHCASVLGLAVRAAVDSVKHSRS